MSADQFIDVFVADVADDCYILTDNDGQRYELPAGLVDVHEGQLVQLREGLHLRLHMENMQNNNLQNNNQQKNKEEENRDIAEWCDSATKALIALYKEKKILVENRRIKTLKSMWTIIEGNLKQLGYNFTAAQCENKWKSLERGFKNVLENKKKTGRGRRSCPYEKELANILVERASIAPPVVMDSHTITEKADMVKHFQPIEIDVDDDEDMIDQPSTSGSGGSAAMVGTAESVAAPETPKSGGRASKKFVAAREITKLREVLVKHHEEKKEFRERMLAETKRKNDLLEKYLEMQLNK